MIWWRDEMFFRGAWIEIAMLALLIACMFCLPPCHTRVLDINKIAEVSGNQYQDGFSTQRHLSPHPSFDQTEHSVKLINLGRFKSRNGQQLTLMIYFERFWEREICPNAVTGSPSNACSRIFGPFISMPTSSSSARANIIFKEPERLWMSEGSIAAVYLTQSTNAFISALSLTVLTA